MTVKGEGEGDGEGEGEGSAVLFPLDLGRFELDLDSVDAIVVEKFLRFPEVPGFYGLRGR